MRALFAAAIVAFGTPALAVCDSSPECQRAKQDPGGCKEDEFIVWRFVDGHAQCSPPNPRYDPPVGSERLKGAQEDSRCFWDKDCARAQHEALKRYVEERERVLDTPPPEPPPLTDCEGYWQGSWHQRCHSY